jgi:hypothetical protein
MTRKKAFDFGIECLKPYILRGDKYDDLKNSHFGCSGPNEPSLQIGGYSYDLKRNYTNEKVIITDEEREEEFVFKLMDFYDYLLSPQKRLF